MKLLLLSILIISFNAFSASFEEINLQSFDKDILSERQIRFVDKSDSKNVVHLQVEKFDPQNRWTEKTLKKDVESMMTTRRSMYEMFGFSNVTLDHYDLKEFGSHPQLNLYGSYIKFKKAKVYFAEVNIYFSQNFLQVKILSEKEKLTEGDVQKIVKQIPLDSLGIK